MIIVVKYRILKQPISYGIQKHTKKRAVKHVIMVILYSIMLFGMRFCLEYGMVVEDTDDPVSSG